MRVLFPLRTRYRSDARAQHKPRQAAVLETRTAACHGLCYRFVYASATQRRKQNTFLCVRSSKTPHTQRGPPLKRFPRSVA